MRHAPQRLVHGRCLVLEAKHREPRVTHHRLDQQEVGADSRHVAKRLQWAFQVVQDAVAEDNVEPTQVLKALLHVRLSRVDVREPTTEFGDIL